MTQPASTSLWDADVIVVGAGPAGSAAAAKLARLGRRVLLLEAKRFPRDKVCGDVLLPEVAGSLAELGTTLEDLVPDAHVLEGCGFTTGLGARVGADFRDRRGRRRQWRILPRRVLDERLARHAEHCGATLAEDRRVEQVGSDATRRVNVLRIGHGRTGATYRAPVVIGADGAFSRVAANRGLALADAGRGRRYSVALRGYVDYTSREPRFEAITDGALERGCCWIVPVSPTRANVGIGLLDARRRPTRSELNRHLSRMLGSRLTLQDTTALAGWQLPATGLRRRTVADGVLRWARI